MDEFKALGLKELVIMTDDGSAGRKGLVTEPLKELCAAGALDHAMAIGPAIMMRFCAATTKEFDVATTVSLNPIMVDGTGMCGACRVTVGGVTKFGCVDGPDFDGHAVDFEELMSRQRTTSTTSAKPTPRTARSAHASRRSSHSRGAEPSRAAQARRCPSAMR